MKDKLLATYKLREASKQLFKIDVPLQVRRFTGTYPRFLVGSDDDISILLDNESKHTDYGTVEEIYTACKWWCDMLQPLLHNNEEEVSYENNNNDSINNNRSSDV